MIERPSAETLRWTASFALVVSVHGVAALLALEWKRAPEPGGAPPAAMLIELVAAAPQPEPAIPEEESVPPEPELVQKPPEPELTQEPPPPELPPFPPAPERPAPAVEPEVALQALPPPKPLASSPPPVERSPPPEPALHAIAAAVTAPQAGNTALSPGAVANWQALLLAHLERHKRYPREAQWLKQEGVVEVHFVMDRAGKVLESSIESSSHSAALDKEAIALLARAQPLPEPPEELHDERVELVVPVQFALKR